MRILIAFECSGRARQAFSSLVDDSGRQLHEVWSCDLKPAEDSSLFHLQQDVFEILNDNWDLVIAHPVCRYLALSGVRWLDTEEGRLAKMVSATQDFKRILSCNAKRICVENPRQHGKAIRLIGQSHQQVIHPWQFGHRDSKETWLWLKNLPHLIPADLVGPPPKNRQARKEWETTWRHSNHVNRATNRARSFLGIMGAMALQWGFLDGQGKVREAVRDS